MKNIKFGVFGLGLLVAVVTAVSSLGAQTRVPFDFAQGGQATPGIRTERPDPMVLDGRGAQLGVMVSDVDAKAASGGVKIDEVNEDSPAERPASRPATSSSITTASGCAAPDSSRAWCRKRPTVAASPLASCATERSRPSMPRRKLDG